MSTHTGMSDTRENRSDSDVVTLTRREMQVSALVAEGLTNRAIAESLTISKRTVDGHMAKILDKFGFVSRVQVATWITRNSPS